MAERSFVATQEHPKQTAAGEWREVKLGDVATIIMGQSPPGSTVSDEPGVALLNGPTEFGPHHPAPVQFTSDPRKFAQPGDVLFCVRGSTTGRMNWADQEYAIGRGVAAIRHTEDPALQPLLRGAIEVALPELLTAATGSTFPNVSASQIADIPYPDLSVKEQRAIAHVLGTLDDKIELNRRMNETLEEMARALFKSWFVDLDPVRAKMDGRWRRGESLPGLPGDLYDLFPDRLVPSELGEVPEGWHVKALGGLVHTTKGRSYRSVDLQESETALVTLKSFTRGGGYRTEGLKPYVGTFKSEQVISPGEIVIACTDVTQAAEVIGRPAIVQPSPTYKTLVASLDTLIVRPNTEAISPAFLYLLTCTSQFTSHTYAHTTGTTVLHLIKDAVPSFKLAVPDLQILKAFNVLATPAFTRINGIHQELHFLAEQRNTLLPKLVSRDLRTKTDV